MTLRFYAPMSTANPTGVRPWNSRLAYYIPNTFAVPTTGRGPFLLNPGVTGGPRMNGGLGAAGFPNFANFQRNRSSRRRFSSNAPQPFYGAPGAVRTQLSGLGLVSLGPTNTFISSNNVRRAYGTGQPVLTQPMPRTGWQAWQPQPPQTTPISYTAAGAPVYATRPAGWRQSRQQSQASGYGVGGATSASIVGYDASGYPIYSSPPPGMVQVGTDSSGTPIYAQPGSTAATALAAQQGAAAGITTGATTTTAAAPTSDFFSEDSLGLGLNNAWYLGIGAVGLWMLTSKRR